MTTTTVAHEFRLACPECYSTNVSTVLICASGAHLAITFMCPQCEQSREVSARLDDEENE